jgi:hypothetical protein
MCPPETKPENPPKRPPRRGQRTLEYWRLWNWLEAEREDRGVTKRAIARHFGHKNATRIGQYLRGEIVAGPEVVRGLAEAIGVSPVEALWRAGYQGAFFHELVELQKLAWVWCREDGVHLDSSDGVFFFNSPVVTPQSDGSNDAPVSLNVTPQREDAFHAPDSLRHRYHTGTIYNYNENGRRIFREVTVPRPLAAAIIIAVGYFPRRGDLLTPTAIDFASEVASAAGPMIFESQRARYRGQRVVVPQVLKRAELISPERWLTPATRAALMAEYVHCWANMTSHRYAEYARLAMYEKGGSMPFEHTSKPEFNDIWMYQTADLPDVTEIALADSNEPPRNN